MATEEGPNELGEGTNQSVGAATVCPSGSMLKEEGKEDAQDQDLVMLFLGRPVGWMTKPTQSQVREC